MQRCLLLFVQPSNLPHRTAAIRADGFHWQRQRPIDWMVCDMVEQPRRVAERMATWAPQQEKRRARIAAAAQDPGAQDALNPAWVCAQLGAQLRPQDVVINEAIRNSPAVLQQISRTEPLTLPIVFLLLSQRC